MGKRKCCDPFSLQSSKHSSSKRKIPDDLFKKLEIAGLAVQKNDFICSNCRIQSSKFDTEAFTEHCKPKKEKVAKLHKEELHKENMPYTSTESENSDEEVNESYKNEVSI